MYKNNRELILCSFLGPYLKAKRLSGHGLMYKLIIIIDHFETNVKRRLRGCNRLQVNNKEIFTSTNQLQDLPPS